MEAIAMEQKAEREWREKMKKEADKLVAEGINVHADVVWLVQYNPQISLFITV